MRTLLAVLVSLLALTGDALAQGKPEVAEIDAWLGGTDGSDGSTPSAGSGTASAPDAGAPRGSRPRDPWGPQP
jgi:hypothetical protein